MGVTPRLLHDFKAVEKMGYETVLMSSSAVSRGEDAHSVQVCRFCSCADTVLFSFINSA